MNIIFCLFVNITTYTQPISILIGALTHFILFLTIMQARTYLFCAIRPEVQFLKYTFATLGFAKNASVVKLAPKKVPHRIA